VPVWAITGDEPARLRSFRDEEGIGFPILLDPEGETFERYGIRNEGHQKTVPHPTVIVVDAEGVARWVVSDENYKVRPPASEVLAAVYTLTGAAASPPD
jgi:peroxiredoxin